MSPAEKCELALVPLLAATAWLLAPLLPTGLSLGHIFLVCSVLLLLQSLVRDLWLLASMRRHGKAESREKAPCMCVESTVGLAGVVMGLTLLAVGLTQTVAIHRWGWGGLVLSVTGIGFLIRNLVFEWSPWRIRLDKNHMNIVFAWKR